MIVNLIQTLGGWSWWVLGLVLLAVEVAVPGFFFLWFGIAAILIGTSALLVHWPWQTQVIGFVILSVVAALLARRFVGSPSSAQSADPLLNLRAERLQGRTFVLTEPIVEGSGRVQADDTIWQVRGGDAPAGARVVVTGAEASVLKVERA